MVPEPEAEPEPEPQPEPQPAVVPSPEPAPRFYLDVPALLGLDEKAAGQMLGAPVACEAVNPSGATGSRRCDYREGNIEVVFIHGKADWITIYGPGDSRAADTCLRAPFSAAAIERVNLVGTPTATSPIGLFWVGSVPGIRKVSVFGRGDELGYIYVKGYTR